MDDARGLFPHLLGERWRSLPPAVRLMHGAEKCCIAHGSATVDGGHGAVATALRRILGLPAPAANVPLHIEITRCDLAETWTRRFGTHRFVSHLRSSARFQRASEERIGLVALTFEPRVIDGGLSWTTLDARILGIPLPHAWFDVRASNRECEGRYRFDIEVMLPRIGRLVAYSGTLDVDDDA